MAGRPRWRRGVPAAGSVVLGALAGAGINVLTSAWSWAVAAAVAVTVGAWAALEWHRACGDDREDRVAKADDGGVRQKIRRVTGHVTGARSSHGAVGISVLQEIDEVVDGGEVIGYTDEPR
jgi:hypothetical protein